MALADELKIAGNNVLLIMLPVLTLFTLTARIGGDLIDWGPVGFEVLTPFCTTVLVCAWVKTVSDPLIDVIAVQAKSLFLWVAGRFAAVYGMAGALCVAGMIVLNIMLPDSSIGEMFFVYMGTTFFLSSLGVLVSFFSRQSHAPAVICGTVWFFSLMVRAAFVENLTKHPFLAYIYPFSRFAAPESRAWAVNKAVFFLSGIIMWSAVYLTCRKRNLKLE